MLLKTNILFTIFIYYHGPNKLLKYACTYRTIENKRSSRGNKC